MSVYSAVLKSKLASQLVPALERIQGLPASSLKAVAAASGLAQPQFGEALAKINGLSEPLRQEIETTVREVYSKSCELSCRLLSSFRNSADPTEQIVGSGSSPLHSHWSPSS